MRKHLRKSKQAILAFPICALSAAISSFTFAQETEDNSTTSPIEEVLILGRLQNNAQDIIVERMELEVAVDILGAEQIGRIGDSTAAVALKRVPGLTLVNDKFVYVRGLGERYSSTTLNLATVPSPDLTRNVIPLDIFPATVIESIAVQKGYTVDIPATFGGGNINIRTNGIPKEFVFILEAGAGINTESSDYLTYNGGSDDRWGKDDGTRALSQEISTALNTYFPNFDIKNFDSVEASLTPGVIQDTLARQGQTITIEEAAAINANLASTIYRDIDIREENSSIQDVGYSINIGNVFPLGEQFEFGIMATGDYDRTIRSETRTARTFDTPDDEFTTGTRSTENVSITTSLNFGVRWGDEHEVQSKNIFLRNTDDQTSLERRFNTTAGFSSGFGFLDRRYRYEQRELEIYQLTGRHQLGYETKEKLGLGDSLSFLDDLEFTWFYSDSTATTDIPSETNIEASMSRDRDTDEIIASQLIRKVRMMDVRFTELEDKVESSGFELNLPIDAGDWQIALSGGGKYDNKTRVYEQLDLSIGSTNSAVDSTLSGEVSEVLSDENITNPDFGYEITYQDGLSRNYLAATKTDAFFGAADLFWKDTIRVVLGARYEEYKQFSAPWFPNRILGPKVDVDGSGDLTNGESPDTVFYLEDVYPSLALTYVVPNFWADDFNLRFSASETVVLPDLREISPASYEDPLTGVIVSGNPNAIQSNFKNYDLRAEWFFGSGDNFTVSMFYKDISNPIEFFLETGTEDSLNATIENAESGSVQGIEFEWLKNLSFLGSFAEAFFVSGNLTFAESELIVGDEIEVSVTNRERPLQGASEYVANIQFGFDSEDGKHAATLAYNVFGERIYTAGTGEQPDVYEQPFSALDLSYSYFISESFLVKLKARNLLNETVRFRQGDVDLIESEIGQTYNLTFRYTY